MISVLIYFGVEKGKQTTRLFPAIYLENLGALGDKVEAYPIRAVLNKDKTPIIRKVYLK